MRRRNGARRRDLVHRPHDVPLDRRPPLGALQRRLAHGLAQFIAALVKIVPELLLRDEAVEVAVELEEELADGGLVDAGTGEQLLEGRVRDRVFWSGSRVLRQFRPHTLRHAGVDPAPPGGVLLDDAAHDLRRGPDGRRARGDGLEDDGAGAELCPARICVDGV